MTVLEDPDHRPEHRGEAERVEHHRLDRYQHTAGEQEDQQQGDQGDEDEIVADTAAAEVGAPVPLEANEADRAEQAAPVPLDEDDYR